jgi:hypothetical protein
MKLTSNEQLNVMNRHFRAIGMTANEVMELVKRADKGDKIACKRLETIAKGFGSLRAVAETKKVANRSDKLGKSVLKSVTALTQWETYRAGAKHNGFLEVGSDKPTPQKLFESNRRLTISEGIYLMSHHESSALQAMTLNDIERQRLCDDESVKRAAVKFAKRFGLKV